MAEPVKLYGGDEQRLLVAEDGRRPGCGGGGCGEESWRLNFEGLRLSTENKESPARKLHSCLGVSGPEDNVAEYYQQQVEMLDGFNEMDALTERGFIPGLSKEEKEKLAKSETFAIRISNIANMFLFIAKVYASIRSGSLAIVASTLDSLLDLLSGFILWFTAFSMSTPNPYQYPIGKKRMQPLGILVFASVMATLGLQIILESVQQLVSGESDFNLTKNHERWLVGIMLSVTVVKLLLVLYCRSFANEIVKAYAQDHFFDVITNIIGLIAALLANYVRGWMDPVGAIILALYTIRTWSMTVLENVNSLVGKSATPDYLRKLTYLCWNHHKAIKHIDTVRAYTFGSHYFVEVDIVLPAAMPLQEAHDIGESLQEKLELLPEIERAFVHLDYEYSHKPEHAQAYS
ncbi:Metal tolerance protein 5-like protein [Drosera capensis]